MRKGIYVILVIILVGVGYLIWNENKPASDEPGNEHIIENVEFSEELVVEEITFDSEKQSLRYVVENNTGKTLEYGAMFTIMKLSADNKLLETDLTDDLAFDMMLRSVEAGASFSDEILFSLFTKTIDSGTYYVIRAYMDSQGNEYIPKVPFLKDGDTIQSGD